MNGKNFATNNSTPVNITAPSACEGLRLSSPATFTFTWVTRSGEVDPNSGVKAGAAVGDALIAEELSATDYWLEVVAPRGLPFTSGELIGTATSSGTNVIAARPIRHGNA